MKPTITLILLFNSLSAFSQTEKGDYTLSPNINDIAFTTEDKILRVSTAWHYYLSDQWAIGGLLSVNYASNDPQNTTSFYRRNFSITLSPEIQYNFLKTRFSPFAKLRVINLEYRNQFVDNPVIPVINRNINQYIIDIDIFPSIGINYFVKDRFAFQVLTNLNFKGYGQELGKLGIGCTFILTGRTEILNPREME